METQSAFDLNAALTRWRDSLHTQGVQAEEVEELETHLLDTMHSLEASPLSAAERFLVAESRVGRAETLAAQYQTADPVRVWTSRLFWMLTGILTFFATTAFCSFFSACLVRLGMYWSVDATLLGMVGVVVNLVVYVLAGCLLWWAAKSRITAGVKSPRLIRLSIGLGIAVVMIIGNGIMPWMFGPMRIDGPPFRGDLPQYFLVQNIGSLLLPRVGLLVMAIWLWRQARQKQSTATAGSV